MDIYRAQRQFRTHDQDVAGSSATNPDWTHGSKGCILNIIGAAAGVGAVAIMLKGATGATFSFSLPVRTGEPSFLGIMSFGGTSNLGGINRSMVGLY